MGRVGGRTPGRVYTRFIPTPFAAVREYQSICQSIGRLFLHIYIYSYNISKLNFWALMFVAFILVLWDPIFIPNWITRLYSSTAPSRLNHHDTNRVIHTKTAINLYAVSSEPASTSASLRALVFFIKTHKKHVVHGPAR